MYPLNWFMFNFRVSRLVRLLRSIGIMQGNRTLPRRWPLVTPAKDGVPSSLDCGGSWNQLGLAGATRVNEKVIEEIRLPAGGKCTRSVKESQSRA
jgi:hypothetical protein